MSIGKEDIILMNRCISTEQGEVTKTLDIKLHLFEHLLRAALHRAVKEVGDVKVEV